MNHNQLLNVDPTASASEIQTAFRKAALEVHPDHSNSPEAAEAFARIKEARDELMKRAKTVELARDSDSIQASTAAAVKATSNAAFATTLAEDLYDGFTPEEIIHIQALDQAVYKSRKRSLFGRVKESAELRRHKNKIKTINKRISGKY